MGHTLRALYLFWFILGPMIALIAFIAVLFSAPLLTISFASESYAVSLNGFEWSVVAASAAAALSAYWPLRRLFQERAGEERRGLVVALAWPLLPLLFIGAALTGLWVG